MYFFSNKYMQISNNTKTIMSVRIGITPLTFLVFSLCRFHLETKSMFLASSNLSTLSFFFEKEE